MDACLDAYVEYYVDELFYYDVRETIKHMAGYPCRNMVTNEVTVFNDSNNDIPPLDSCSGDLQLAASCSFQGYKKVKEYFEERGCQRACPPVEFARQDLAMKQI